MSARRIVRGRVIVSLEYGEVRYFRMARAVFGRASYWTGVYPVRAGRSAIVHRLRRAAVAS